MGHDGDVANRVRHKRFVSLPKKKRGLQANLAALRKNPLVEQLECNSKQTFILTRPPQPRPDPGTKGRSSGRPRRDISRFPEWDFPHPVLASTRKNTQSTKPQDGSPRRANANLLLINKIESSLSAKILPIWHAICDKEFGFVLEAVVWIQICW
jgi:hypothetical protein